MNFIVEGSKTIINLIITILNIPLCFANPPISSVHLFSMNIYIYIYTYMSQGLFMRLKIQPTLNVGYIAVSAAVSLACAESTRDVHLQH